MPPVIDWNVLRVYLAAYERGLHDPDVIERLFERINEILAERPENQERLEHCLRAVFDPSLVTRLLELHFDARSPLVLNVQQFLALRTHTDRLRAKLWRVA